MGGKSQSMSIVITNSTFGNQVRIGNQDDVAQDTDTTEENDQ